MARKIYHCNNCGKDIYPKSYHSQTSIALLDFVLLLFFVIPLIIFYLATANKKICPLCGSSNIYPLSEEETAKYTRKPNKESKVRKRVPKWYWIFGGIILSIIILLILLQ